MGSNPSSVSVRVASRELTWMAVAAATEHPQLLPPGTPALQRLLCRMIASTATSALCIRPSAGVHRVVTSRSLLLKPLISQLFTGMKSTACAGTVESSKQRGCLSNARDGQKSRRTHIVAAACQWHANTKVVLVVWMRVMCNDNNKLEQRPPGLRGLRCSKIDVVNGGLWPHGCASAYAMYHFCCGTSKQSHN